MAEAEPVGEHEHQAKSDDGMNIDLVCEERDLLQVNVMMARDQRGRARETNEDIVSWHRLGTSAEGLGERRRSA